MSIVPRRDPARPEPQHIEITAPTPTERRNIMKAFRKEIEQQLETARQTLRLYHVARKAATSQLRDIRKQLLGWTGPHKTRVRIRRSNYRGYRTEQIRRLKNLAAILDAAAGALASMEKQADTNVQRMTRALKTKKPTAPRKTKPAA